MRTGSTVSHFRLLSRLGAGGCGEVFSAEDIHLGRKVAIKFLHSKEDPVENERILQEARLCASVIHPNIAVVYEVGWHESSPFLVMELIEGDLLSRRIRNQKVAHLQALKYMRQVLDALE